jgi:hypothetical protein
MDHEDFGFGHGRGDGAHAVLDVFLFVEAGDDDGDAGVRFHSESLEKRRDLSVAASLSKFQVVRISIRRKIAPLSHG